MEDNKKILNKIMNYLKTNLGADLLIEMNNKINCLNNFCKGDGCGLISGVLIDMFVTKFLTNNLSKFKEYHKGEIDCSLCDENFSFKKINGKSILALDWSKNLMENKKEKFTCNMIIINLKTCKWWKQKSSARYEENIDFTKTIPAGIYIIDKYYCKNKVIFTSNNKTNTLISSKYLYMMLYNSIEQNMYITLPKINKIYTFDILSSFVE